MSQLTQPLAPEPSDAEIIPLKEATERAGLRNFFQYRTIAVICVQRIAYGFLIMSFPYLLAIPTYQCSNATQGTYTCTDTPTNCPNNLQPAPGSQDTLVTEFGLYCSYTAFPGYIESLFMVGNLIGLVFIAKFTDRMGRRKGLIVSVLIMMAGTLGSALSQNLWVFIIFFSVIGMGVGPYVPATYTYLNETCEDKLRVRSSSLINIVRTVFTSFVGFLAMIIQNSSWYWRLFLLIYVLGIFVIQFPFMYGWFYESPKFLILQKQFEKAYATIKKMAKVNKRDLAPFKLKEEVSANKDSKAIENAAATSGGKVMKMKYKFRHLFKYDSLRKPTIILCILFFIDNSIYFGTTFAVPYVSVSTPAQTFALSFFEGLAGVFAMIWLPKLKRVSITLICHVFAILACLPFMLVSVPSACQTSLDCIEAWIYLASISVVRFLISITTMVYYIYNSEIFPTPIRSIGSGVTSIASKLGPAIIPIGLNYAVQGGLDLYALFGMLMIPTLVLSGMMKETHGQPLPEEIEELRRRGTTKIFRKETTKAKRSQGDQGEQSKLTGAPTGNPGSPGIGGNHDDEVGPASVIDELADESFESFVEEDE